MPVGKKSQTKKPQKPVTEKAPREAVRPLYDPEDREQQMVNLAINLAQKQLMDGTASSAVIQHYLKVGSKRESLEREILEKQSTLIGAKSDSIIKGQDDENIAKQALEAMTTYSSSSK